MTSPAPANTSFTQSEVEVPDGSKPTSWPNGLSGEITLDVTTEDDAKPASQSTSATVDADGDTETTETVPVIVYDASVTSTEDEYSSQGRVVWNLGMQPAGASGTVTLVVEVLSTATPVGRVDNTAYVRINGDAEQQTKTVENPTPEVHKTENAPGDGNRVNVNDQITYTIDWNSNDTAHEEDEKLATVTVVDPLDPGVDFIEASYTIPDGKTITLDAGDSDKTVTSDEKVNDSTAGEYNGKPLVTISYDAEKHTVTWTLLGAAAPEKGEVHLTVKVTTRALVNSGDGAFDPNDTDMIPILIRSLGNLVSLAKRSPPDTRAR